MKERIDITILRANPVDELARYLERRLDLLRRQNDDPKGDIEEKTERIRGRIAECKHLLTMLPVESVERDLPYKTALPDMIGGPPWKK